MGQSHLVYAALRETDEEFLSGDEDGYKITERAVKTGLKWEK